MDLGHEDRWDKGNIVQLCSPSPWGNVFISTSYKQVLYLREVLTQKEEAYLRTDIEPSCPEVNFV